MEPLIKHFDQNSHKYLLTISLTWLAFFTFIFIAIGIRFNQDLLALAIVVVSYIAVAWSPLTYYLLERRKTIKKENPVPYFVKIKKTCRGSIKDSIHCRHDPQAEYEDMRDLIIRHEKTLRYIIDLSKAWEYSLAELEEEESAPEITFTAQN